MGRRPRRPKSAPDQRLRIPPRRLEAMIEEAIVDAYTESEQAGSFHVMIERELELPFETTVLGVTVSVKRVDITEANDVMAVCYRGRDRQAIPILEPRDDLTNTVQQLLHLRRPEGESTRFACPVLRCVPVLRSLVLRRTRVPVSEDHRRYAGTAALAIVPRSQSPLHQTPHVGHKSGEQRGQVVFLQTRANGNDSLRSATFNIATPSGHRQRAVSTTKPTPMP